MGKSSKSHGKKSDKETQSPLLKIFKDMIQKENNDPEKAKLLKDTQSTKKRKHYSSSRSKSNHVIRSCNSSSSERFNRNHYKPQVKQEQKCVQYDCHSQNVPFQGAKKDSSWFWGSPDIKKQQSEETCSCVSCALKRIASSEYACKVCLVFLFLITGTIACLMLFHSVPTSDNTVTKKTMPQTNNENFRKKVGILSDAKDLRFGNELARLKENLDDSYRKDWDDSLLGQYGRLSGITDRSFHNSNFQDLNNLEDSSNKASSDLSTILDKDKLNDLQSSENLKNFYKKLLQTDAQIKNLKLGMNYLTMKNSEPNNVKPSFDRFKRSLKDTNKRDFNKNNIFYQMKKGIKVDNFIKRPKRLDKNKEQQIGFFVEKKQIVLQYQDPLKRKGKCSHAPKDLKSHETQMKHPFYKNSQRIDELLDQFLDKKLPELIPEVIADSDRIDLLSTDKKFKDSSSKEIDKNKLEDKQNENKKEDQLKDDENINHFNKLDEIRDQSTKSDTDVMLSASTVLSNLETEKYPATPIYKERLRNVRKLMQADENDESISYENLKEIMADDTETHNENDKIVDTQKRNDEWNNQDLSEKQTTFDSNKVYHFNWKGPMQFKPDELNTMIEQVTIENINKMDIPINTKDNVPEVDDAEPGINDVEYIEDYLDNKFNKLVRMAQAYSDYGVLDGKKEPENERNEKVTQRTVKLSVSKRNIAKGLFRRLKKGKRHEKPGTLKETTSANVNTQSTTNARKDVFQPKVISNTIHKHIKLLPDKSDDSCVELTPLTSLMASEIENTKSNSVINNDHESNDKAFDKDNSMLLMSNNQKNLKNKHEFRKTMSKSCNNNGTNDEEEYNQSYHSRSLKSVIYDNESGIELNTSIKSIQETKLNDNNKEMLNKSGNDLNIVPVNNKEWKTGIEISEFFNMISEWFSTLANISMDDNDTRSSSSSPIMKFAVNTSDPILNQDITKQQPMNTTDAIYPMYDSDMIENIAHRSRVLMALDEINTSKMLTEVNKDFNNAKVASNKSSDIAEIKNENVTTVIKNNNDTVTPRVEKNVNVSLETDKDKNVTESKTIVKRSLGDSGLIFWNDIYDDEYGLKVDPLDDNIGEKRSSKSNDFMKRSGMWIQDKFRKITDNYFGRPKKKKDAQKRNSRSIKYYRADMYPKEPYNLKRKTRFVNDENLNEKPTNFAELTKKMKKVCKEAAKTVQDTKTMKVPHNDKEETMATSLMQQLVQLMTDLVNFQVQQTTCLSLPPDLYNFLEWLTSPTSSAYQSEGKSSTPGNEYEQSNDDNMELTTTESSEMEIYPGSRSECLRTLQAVQELIQQYNDMSDEDKNKMSGVKDYLENQLDFLNRQLAFFDEYILSTSYPNQGRFRRHVTSQMQRKPKNKLKRSLKTKFRKIMQYFGNNRTRIVPNSDGVFRVTEKKKVNNVFRVTEKKKVNKKPNTINKIVNKKERKQIKNKKTKNKIAFNQNTKAKEGFFKVMKEDHGVLEKKRNLHDVYYKAIADAKRVSTIKSITKKIND